MFPAAKCSTDVREERKHMLVRESGKYKSK
jgi:hypothetical protein